MKPVETIMSSGGPMASKDLKVVQKFCKKFINLYGSTESGALAMKILKFDEEMKNYDAGLPLRGVDMKVVNTDGNLCEVGKVGEDYIRNKSSSAGYLHEEQDWHNSNRMKGYWFKTGDAGYIADDGHLYVTGRISESIKFDGVIVSPSHFEDIFMKHQSVEGAVAFGIQQEFAGIAVVLRGDETVTKEELLAFYKNEQSVNCTDNINVSNSDKITIVFLDTFPMLSNGKIARKSIKEMALQNIRFAGSKNCHLQIGS